MTTATKTSRAKAAKKNDSKKTAPLRENGKTANASPPSTPVAALITSSFDYTGLDVGTTRVLRQAATMIRELQRSIAADAIAIGRHLWKVRGRLEANSNTSFWVWAREELDWSRSRVRDFMNLAAKFGDWPESRLSQFHESALLELAKDTTPEEAIADAANLADAASVANTSKKLNRHDVQHIRQKRMKTAAKRRDIARVRFARLGSYLKEFLQNTSSDYLDELHSMLSKYCTRVEKRIREKAGTDDERDPLPPAA